MKKPDKLKISSFFLVDDSRTTCKAHFDVAQNEVNDYDI